MLDKLLEIGLSGGEAKLYLELLSIGPQIVSVLSKRLCMPRSTVYSLLNSLEKWGLVSFRVNGGTKFYSSNDPNCLIGYLDRKCRTFDYYRNEMLSLIPRFRSIMGKYEFKKPVVSYFEGLDGIKQILYDCTSAIGYFYACLPADKWFESGNLEFIDELRQFLSSEMTAYFKIIVPDSKNVRAFLDLKTFSGGRCDNGGILFLDPMIYGEIFQNEMCIYDSKVAILHFNKGSEFGVLIDSNEVCEMQKKIFEIAWHGLAGH